MSGYCLPLSLIKFSFFLQPSTPFPCTWNFYYSIFVWAPSESLENILRSCSIHESFFPRSPSSVRSRLSLNLQRIKTDLSSPRVWSELWPLGLGGCVPDQQQNSIYKEEKLFELAFKNPVKCFKIGMFFMQSHTQRRSRKKKRRKKRKNRKKRIPKKKKRK